MFLFKRRELVGIDIGSSSVKLVQLRESRGGYELVKLGMAPLPHEAVVDNHLKSATVIVEAIRALMTTHHVTLREASSSVSGTSVIIRKLGFPAMSADALAEQITWEAEQNIPFDINDANIDYHLLGTDATDPGRLNVILAVSKKDVIGEYLSLFSQAGLTLKVIDVDAFALQNAFEANYDPDEGEVIALANIGASAINLAVVRGGESLFTSDIPAGSGLSLPEPQKRSGPRFEEALPQTHAAAADGEDAERMKSHVNESLALQLQRGMEFYSPGTGEAWISRLYVSGGCSKDPLLLDAIRKRLDLPVELLDPFRKITCPATLFSPAYLADLGPHSTVAVGLAMRRFGDK